MVTVGVSKCGWAWLWQASFSLMGKGPTVPLKIKILFGMVVNSKISRLHWYPHTCAHPHTHTHTHTHTCTCTHMRTHTNMCTHTHTQNRKYRILFIIWREITVSTRTCLDKKEHYSNKHTHTHTHTHTHLPCMTSCCPRHVGDHLCLETVSFFRRQTKRLPWTMAATKSARSVSMKAWESVQVHLYIKPH